MECSYRLNKEGNYRRRNLSHNRHHYFLLSACISNRGKELGDRCRLTVHLRSYWSGSLYICHTSFHQFLSKPEKPGFVFKKEQCISLVLCSPTLPWNQPMLAAHHIKFLAHYSKQMKRSGGNGSNMLFIFPTATACLDTSFRMWDGLRTHAQQRWRERGWINLRREITADVCRPS